MKSKRNTFAFILVIVGALLLLRAINPYFFALDDMIKFLLPVGIIIFGFWLIFRKRKQTANFNDQDIHININTDSDSTSFNSTNSHSSFSSAQNTGSQQSDTFTESPRFSEEPEHAGVDGRIKYSKMSYEN